MEVVAKCYWVAFVLVITLVFAHQARSVWHSRTVSPAGRYLALAAAGILTAYLLAALGAATIGLALGMFLHFRASIGPAQAFALACLVSLLLTLVLSVAIATTTRKLATRRQPPNNSSKPTPLRGAA